VVAGSVRRFNVRYGSLAEHRSVDPLNVRLPSRFCGFEKEAGSEDYLEFQWAESQTGIAAKDIDTNFDNATKAALHLATQNDAMSLPGYTGKISCD
jgi:hypothetical protein